MNQPRHEHAKRMPTIKEVSQEDICRHEYEKVKPAPISLRDAPALICKNCGKVLTWGEVIDELAKDGYTINTKY